MSVRFSTTVKKKRKPDAAALLANEDDLHQIINTIPALAWSAHPDGSAEFFNQYYLALLEVYTMTISVRICSNHSLLKKWHPSIE